MIRGNLGSGQALVPTAPVPDWATWSSGGPISRGSGNVVVDRQDFFVVPGGGQANAIEGEAGALWTGKPYGFDPGGVVFGDAAVSSGSAMPPVRVTANIVSSVGPTVTMALGAGAGAALMPNHRAVGTILGALAGGILGIIFSPG